MMTFEECWYKDTCNYKDKCGPHCTRFELMHFLFSESLLPEKMWKSQKLKLRNEDKDAYVFLNEIDMYDFVKKGNNLYLCSSNTGNGKTSWAIKLLGRYFNLVWDCCSLNCMGLYINVPSFITKSKLNIGTPSKEYNELMEKIQSVPLVIWDDIGMSGLTDYEQSLLVGLIDTRLQSGKSNIYTSNQTVGTAENFLGQRLFSRVVLASDIVEFKSLDYRSAL